MTYRRSAFCSTKPPAPKNFSIAHRARSTVPTLLELQRAMQAGLIGDNRAAVAAMLAQGVASDRLATYRNTIFTALIKTLRLSYPAIVRLVGREFFDGAAEVFVAGHMPKAACLDQYGDEFPGFLRRYGPARSLAYLADVAQLEWAVNGALHAADVAPLNEQAWTLLAAEDATRIRLVPHPAVRWLRLRHPAYAVWRAVLDGDDAALRSLDLDSGPVHLLVERSTTGVEVHRLDATAWRF